MNCGNQLYHGKSEQKDDDAMHCGRVCEETRAIWLVLSGLEWKQYARQEV
jgi:hypothetical protein